MASDSKSAKYVLCSNFVLILWKLFVLLSFDFWFGSWARNGMGGFFSYDVMQSERGMFTTKSWGGGWGVLGSIFAGYVLLASQNSYSFIVYFAVYCSPEEIKFSQFPILFLLTISFLCKSTLDMPRLRRNSLHSSLPLDLNFNMLSTHVFCTFIPSLLISHLSLQDISLHLTLS